MTNRDVVNFGVSNRPGAGRISTGDSFAERAQYPTTFRQPSEPPDGEGLARGHTALNTFTGLKRRIGGVYYGWRIAAAGAVNMFVSSGPTFQASSTIFAAVEEEFGWSRGLTTGVASFGRFGGAMLGPLEGILTDRFGAARMVLVGFLIGGGGLILFSQITGPVTYYLAYLLLATGFSIGGFTPSMAAVNAWMPTRRAIAGAIVVGGSSAAGFAVPLLVLGNLLVRMAPLNVLHWRRGNVHWAGPVPGRVQAAAADGPASNGFQQVRPVKSRSRAGLHWGRGAENARILGNGASARTGKSIFGRRGRTHISTPDRS